MARKKPAPAAPAKFVDETGRVWPKGQTPYVVEVDGVLTRVTGGEYRARRRAERKAAAAAAYRQMIPTAAQPTAAQATPDTAASSADTKE
jgi:hypothetical protein